MSEKQKRLVLIEKEERWILEYKETSTGDFNCKLRKV